MQRETSNDSFLDYGSVYHQPIDREHPELSFGTFSVVERGARMGINPSTKKPIEIAAKKVVKFKPGTELTAE